ncbi:MAG: CRISPR-associated endonuclease Cas2 [Treponema sp. CETP13]|nr:MAG: CRISPR-associated endonuclease Cas2 [Treponema sp. CETP13]
MILYDIRDVKRLAKVEKVVESFGWRVQKSVFESCANELQINLLKSRLNRIIADEDFVLFFNICERCWQKKLIFGKTGNSNPMNDDFMIL